MIKYVKELSGIEILSDDIFLPDGDLLIPKGTLLKPEYIRCLIQLEIEMIPIEDPCIKKNLSDIEKRNMVISIYKSFVELMDRNIYKNSQVLKKIKPLASDLVSVLQSDTRFLFVDLVNRTGSLYEHCIYTSIMSVRTGIKLGLNQERLNDLAFGAMIHDLGLCFIAVPYQNCIFQNMNPIDVFEIKKHTILGYTSIENERWIPAIVKYMVLSHHEKLDGSGYPLKQKRKETECLILQICDSFDVIISGITCEKADFKSAIKEIKDNKNIRYDREIAEVFLEMMEQNRKDLSNILEKNN